MTDGLPQLLAQHSGAVSRGDFLAARQAESRFVTNYSTTPIDVSELDDALQAEYYRLRYNTSRDMGNLTAAHEAAMAWQALVEQVAVEGAGQADTEEVPDDEKNSQLGQLWQARARLALDEADRYVQFNSDEFPPDDSDIPLISRFSRHIPELVDVVVAYPQDYSLIETLLIFERACTRVRRNDLSQTAADVTRELNATTLQHAFDDWIVWCDAQWLRSQGKLKEAARLAAGRLEQDRCSDAFRIYFLRFLGEVSAAAGQNETAHRMFERSSAAAEEQDLVLDQAIAAALINELPVNESA